MNSAATSDSHAFRYYVGLSSKGKPVATPQWAAERVGREISERLATSGATVVAGQGWWRGEAETTLIVYVSGVTIAEHERLVAWLCSAFAQDCVGVEPAARIELRQPAAFSSTSARANAA